MSSERNIRHVEDVFSGRVNGVTPHKQQNILDRKSSFNMFKNKPAPRPPSDQMALPKIGNYQPKMLIKSTPDDSERLSENREHKDIIHHAQVHHNPGSAPPMIIGDKDIPLRIENDTVDIRDDPPVPAPRRKRRAPSAPDAEMMNSEPSTSNPLFGRSMSQRSDEERFDMDLEEQGGDIDFGSGLDNPGFHSRERKISGMSRDSDITWAEEQHQRIEREHQNSKNGITYPYIPPPDYEDEEMTMDFEDDYEPIADYERNNGRVYRELEGEDFGKYMQEDDYEFDAPHRPVRRPPPGGNGGHFMQNRPRHIQRPTKSNKNIDKKLTKSKKKHAPSEQSMKRNTIRDFTFSDSKIGWGDRTTKSTSAKGRYIKHNKDRMRIDNAETFAQKDSKGSYEEFLRVKNGIPLESPNSSDSGVDTGEERHHNMDMYQRSQPKQMRNGKYENKQSMWQRLTWRFRKAPPVHRIESERL